MKQLGVLPLALCLLALVACPLSAKETASSGKRPFLRALDAGDPRFIEPATRALMEMESAAVDTYCIISYNFEVNNWQGWTRWDRTAQPDTFFHVDDFSGLGGGSYGMLVPIEGTKSMWCGARANPNDPYMCGWKRAPGYANDWNQMLVTDAFGFAGAITFSYRIAWDSEPDYDYTYVEYDAGDGNWQEITSYDADGTASASHSLVLTQAQTKLRFRFTSDGAWSDLDGLWNTDGACIVDELRVRDVASLDNYQNFESFAVGAHNAGIWHARVSTPYGTFSGLRTNLIDKDPCNENFTTQIVFFVGSPNPSAGYPGLYDTPFCTGPGGVTPPCQNDFVVSPVFDLKKYSTARNSVQNADIPAADLPYLGITLLAFDAYVDNDPPNAVFYDWTWQSIDASGCPAAWWTDTWVYYATAPTNVHAMWDISGWEGNNKLRLSCGVIDLCEQFYALGGCLEHTPAPWFDNIRIYRVKRVGPQIWNSNAFVDNFPSDEFDMESFVRCDVQGDLNDVSNPIVLPPDEMWVETFVPNNVGIAVDPTLGGSAVYLHVKATYVGPAPVKPNLAGPSLAGSVTIDGDPPLIVNFNYVSDDGVWTIIQCDTARTAAGIFENQYMVDLNDELFTRGYQIEYYFLARDNNGLEATVPAKARTAAEYYEMTCLPTLSSNVLHVNDSGTQEYWRTALEAVLAPPYNKVDVYHDPAPSTSIPSGVGSRAKNHQLTTAYDIIVWESGRATFATISEGTDYSDKSNDCQMLVDWLTTSEHPCGLWICGNNVAEDLSGSTAAAALQLMGVWCGVDFASRSYFDLTGGLAGGIASPLVTGEADAGIFVHGGIPDKFYLESGCPRINEFDVLEKTGTAKYALSYPQHLGANNYAAIANTTVNSADYPVKTLWCGFGFYFTRSDAPGAPIDRFHIVDDVFKWFQAPTNADITQAEAPRVYRLAQNFPNPFNPSTTIGYDLREKGPVSIRIYDVGGHLVRTLVDGVKEAGRYSAVWDGASERGTAVASGIYFYKMEAGAFSATKKLVLLR